MSGKGVYRRRGGIPIGIAANTINIMNSSKRIAVITGADSGIGKEFARLISTRAEIDEVWAIARNNDRLDELKTELGEKVVTFSLDLKNRENIFAVQNRLESEAPEVLYLINCAGYAVFCDYSDLSVGASLGMVDLNISALVAMGLVCIPFMPRGAHIINMASQAAFQPVPFQNIYSATKAFVRNYTRALNVELKEKGVTATAVCPGWMNTRLIERGKIGARRATNKFPFITDPAPVAKKAIADADKGKDMSVYGFVIKLSHVMSKLLPQRLLMWIWTMQQGIDV